MTLIQIFAKVLNMSLTASLVIVLVIAARFVLRKSPKVFSYALWAVVLFRLLCPVSLPSPVSLLGLLDAPVAQTEGITTTVEYIPYKVVEAAAETPQPDQLPQNTLAQAPTQSQQTTVEPQREPLSAAEIITYIWLAGIAVMVIVGVGSYLRFRKHLTGAMQVKDNIYLVDHIDSAFVAGLIRPKVYLPSDIPLKQMGYIIAHEQYHIRRLDHVTKHLSFAALCIHWFNPFVWLAFILSGKDLEMSCDEAVIKRLGEGIRADYSASLLSLATGRRIIAGTPLAFGEGDTKGRINNMAKWKQPKKWVSIVSFILCFSILTACAANPTQNIVTSKNDGAFESNIQQTSPQQQPDGTVIVRNSSFTSTDGSVEYIWNLDQTISDDPMPVIEVVPHYFTGEDVHNVAKALFGDAAFYDLGPESQRQFSKSELLEKIQLLTKYSSKEVFETLPLSLAFAVSDLQNQIENYTLQYETAQESSSFEICDWTLKKESYYIDDGDYGLGDGKTDQLKVLTRFEGRDYYIGVSVRDDYMRNYLTVELGDGSGYFIRTIQYEEMRSTEKPTQDQVNAVTSKAQNMLNQMGLGEYLVAESRIVVSEDEIPGRLPGYTIRVKAIPVINGIPGLLGHTGVTYVNNDLTVESYAPSYAMTYVEFSFNAEGNLISFQMDSPIEEKAVVNNNVAILPLEELFAKAENYLSLYDSESFDGITGNNMFVLSIEKDIPEDSIELRVEITGVRYGLGRISKANSDDSFYYTPAILFEGTIDFCDKNTGEVIDSVTRTLFTINAVDGSII